VGSVNAALDALEDEHFDILLSDLAMPNQDGYELIRIIRLDARPYVRNLEAIAVSAYADEVHRAQAFAAGFDDYLTKPLEQSRLLKLLVEARGALPHPDAEAPDGNPIHRGS
jgi:CheY-like chemotaxis protein